MIGAQAGTKQRFAVTTPRLSCLASAHLHALARASLAAFGLLIVCLAANAQDRPTLTIQQDCQQFAISNDGKIVCSVPHVKRVKKVVIQRDDIWVASPTGKDRLIVDAEKFMPAATPSSYTVTGLAWSPDGERIAMTMTTAHAASATSDDEPESASRVVALLDSEGHEIKVSGSKTRFIESASSGCWLPDDATVVYLSGFGPYQIVRVNPSDGQTSNLFAGHKFEAVTWDAPNNQAFALGEGLLGHEALIQLDLVHETIKEIVSRIDSYKGELRVSPSGKKIAYFADGDTIEVRDMANPAKPLRVKAGFGQFQWGPDERRVLLKRGPADTSDDLVWVGLYDGTFVPALHDLEYHSFAISPNGESIAVTEPGKGVLKVFPLQ